MTKFVLSTMTTAGECRDHKCHLADYNAICKDKKRSKKAEAVQYCPQAIATQNAVQSNELQRNATQCNAMQCNAMQRNAARNIAIEIPVTQCIAKMFNAMKLHCRTTYPRSYITMQHNEMQS